LTATDGSLLNQARVETSSFEWGTEAEAGGGWGDQTYDEEESKHVKFRATLSVRSFEASTVDESQANNNQNNDNDWD